MSPTAMTLAIAVLLAGCKDKSSGGGDAADTGDTGSGYISQTTGEWTDGGSTSSTDGGTVTADGGTVTTDGGTTEGPYATALALYPSSMVVAPEATWSTRLFVTWDDGSETEGDAEWSSTDEAVVTVDAAGIVTAVAAGSAEIQASRDGVMTSVPVEVRDDGLITVTVVDAESGAAHVGAHVRVGTGDSYVETDESGMAQLKWTESGPFTVTAWDRLRVPMTIVGAVGRELIIPMTSTDDIAPDYGSLSGSVDLSDVPSGGGGDLKVGFAAPTMIQTPLIIKEELLLGPPRQVEIYGVETSIPANVFIRNSAEDYEVPAPPGTTGAWAVSAPIFIGDVTSGLAGATDALSVMLEDLDKVAWGWNEGATLAPGQSATAPLAPSVALTEVMTVDAGGLPVGFSGDEDIMVLLGEMLPSHGFAPVGIGIGTFEVDVSVADVSLAGSTGRYAAAIAQVGGLGSGSGAGICTSWGPADGGDVVLPELQQVPALHSFDEPTMVLNSETDGRARFVHILVDGRTKGKWHEIVMDGGAVNTVLPRLSGPFGWRMSRWQMMAFETRRGTFHDLVRDGWPSDAEIASDSHSAGLLEVNP